LDTDKRFSGGLVVATATDVEQNTYYNGGLG